MVTNMLKYVSHLAFLDNKSAFLSMKPACASFLNNNFHVLTEKLSAQIPNQTDRNE